MISDYAWVRDISMDFGSIWSIGIEGGNNKTHALLSSTISQIHGKDKYKQVNAIIFNKSAM